jgi:hypothetical protein
MTPKQKRLSRITYITDEDRTIAMRDDEARERIRETAKTVLIAFAIMLAIIGIAMMATAAKAQDTIIRPRALGGWSVQTPGQPDTIIRPRALGGYTVQTPDGQPDTIIRPRALGGFTIQRPFQAGD